MKFFQSKYYAPITHPYDANEVYRVTQYPNGNRPHMVDNRERQVIRDISYITGTRGGLGRKALEVYCHRAPLFNGLRLDVESVKSTCVLVEDLVDVRMSTDTDVYWQSEDLKESAMFDRVYFHHDLEVFFLIRGNEPDHKHLAGTRSTTSIYVPYFVDQETAYAGLRSSKLLIKMEERVRASIGVLNMRQGKIFDIRSELKELPIDFDTMYPNDFKDVSDKIVDIYSNLEEGGLMLFHGDPGTGKTNYIRWLSRQPGRRMVFVPPDMVQHLTSPTFVDYLLENKGLTLIVEDAEHALITRQGAERNVVSTILGLTDGLLGDVLNVQFICTFNTALKNIDDALLRPGRLLVRHEFRKLTAKEANNYFASNNQEIVVKESMTLASIINYDNMPTVSKVDEPTSFGFNTVK